MKPILFVIIGLLQAAAVVAQPGLPKRPITVSAFAVSPGTFVTSARLPTLPTLIKSGAGLQIGTEFYYRNRLRSQVFQTLDVGGYHLFGTENGLFLASALGYRRYVGRVYGEVRLGVSGLYTRSVPFYEERTDDGTYRSAQREAHTLAPVVGLGTGLRLSRAATLFLRYDVLAQPQFDHPQFDIRQLRQLHVGTCIYLRH